MNINGFFDGTAVRPLDISSFEKNEEVLIFKKEESPLDKFFGTLGDESAEAAKNALADTRKVVPGEWNVCCDI
ncbi:MAG: hypothetical protein KBT11_06530 [Treponema sp.]|nr:hypothetical protein [Candidatus Treponema equifaecale]